MRVWWLFVLAAAVLILPFSLRWAEGNFSLGGDDVYYHARMGVELAQGWSNEDGGVVFGRERFFSPYHVLIALSYRVFGEMGLVVLPLLLAWCSVLLFWLVLGSVGLSQGERFWAQLAFVLSPPLIASGFLLSPHGFVVFLLLAAMVLLRGRAWWVGAAFLVVAAWCGLPFVLAMIGSVLLLMFVHPKWVQRLNVVAVLLVVMALAGWYAPLPVQEAGVEGYVSDLGGVFGVGIFTVLLGVLGLILLWEYKRRFFGAFVIVVAALVAGFFLPGVLVVVSVLLAVLVGIAIERLAQRKWELGMLRQASLLVLFCGLLFSGVSHAVALGSGPPDTNFFNELAREKGVVLTHPRYGFWAEFAGHRVLLDELGAPQRVRDDVDALWRASDAGSALFLIERYGIRYIVITPEMTQGLVWEREEQGLDFLVRTSEMFKRVDSGGNVRVYEVQ